MNRPLLAHVLRAQGLRVVIVTVALVGWGAVMPLIYARFGSQFRQLIDSGLIPEQFTRFGGGDIFTLAGVVALGLVHPITLVLVSIFAVGFTTAAVAGERQRGTLEVFLSRPMSRLSVYLTFLACAFLFVAVALAGYLVGATASAVINDVSAETDLGRVPLLWVNGVFLFGAIACVGLAASVSFDRLTPALGIELAFVLVSYFFEVLGDL